MAKTKVIRIRVPLDVIKTSTAQHMSDLELATIPRLIRELEIRTAAVVVAYAEVPKLIVDKEKGQARSITKGKKVEHKSTCRIHGASPLIGGLVGMIEKAVAEHLQKDED